VKKARLDFASRFVADMDTLMWFQQVEAELELDASRPAGNKAQGEKSSAPGWGLEAPSSNLGPS
jgi:hypothetical protein